MAAKIVDGVGRGGEEYAARRAAAGLVRGSLDLAAKCGQRDAARSPGTSHQAAPRTASG